MAYHTDTDTDTKHDDVINALRWKNSILLNLFWATWKVLLYFSLLYRHPNLVGLPCSSRPWDFYGRHSTLKSHFLWSKNRIVKAMVLFHARHTLISVLSPHIRRLSIHVICHSQLDTSPPLNPPLIYILTHMIPSFTPPLSTHLSFSVHIPTHAHLPPLSSMFYLSFSVHILILAHLSLSPLSWSFQFQFVSTHLLAHLFIRPFQLSTRILPTHMSPRLTSLLNTSFQTLLWMVGTAWRPSSCVTSRRRRPWWPTMPASPPWSSMPPKRWLAVGHVSPRVRARL